MDVHTVCNHLHRQISSEKDEGQDSFWKAYGVFVCLWFQCSVVTTKWWNMHSFIHKKLKGSLSWELHDPYGNIPYFLSVSRKMIPKQIQPCLGPVENCWKAEISNQAKSWLCRRKHNNVFKAFNLIRSYLTDPFFYNWPQFRVFKSLSVNKRTNIPRNTKENPCSD